MLTRQLIEMSRNTQRGFTLIELLVVIAIIGVLSSIVLVSLNNARGKAQDSRIKAQLSTSRSQAEIYYDSQIPPAYTPASNMLVAAATCTGNMFAGAFANNLDKLTGTSGTWPPGTTLSCQSIGTAYAISAGPLPNAGGFWCVDSNGRSAARGAHLPQNIVVC